MKSIAVIFHFSDILSGGNKSLLDLITQWSESQNIKITAVIPDHNPALIRVLESQGIPYISCHYYWVTYFCHERGLKKLFHMPVKLAEGAVNKQTAARLAKQFMKLGITDIYTNTSVITLGALIKRKAPAIRHIWHFREFGEEDQGLAWFPDRKRFYRLVNASTDDVIYISHALQKKYEKYITRPACSVIYDDVSGTNYIRRQQWYSPGNPVRVLMAGQLKEGKGQLEVLKAVLRLHESGIPIRLGIAGKGNEPEYIHRLQQFIRMHQMDSYVAMLGQVQEMNALRLQYDVGVVASRAEAFGRVTVEGMLAGLLMIGADAGGTSELIRDGVNGFLYAPGDDAALAERIRDVYEGRADVKAIASAGQEFAVGFTKGRCAEAVLALL